MRFIAIIAFPADPRPIPGVIVMTHAHQLFDQIEERLGHAQNADSGISFQATFYLPEGEQMLGAIATGICIGGLVETKASVRHSRPAVFRISYGSSGEFSIQPTAF